MNLVIGTDLGATHCTLSAPALVDVYVVVSNKGATVSQIQAALSKISAFVGKMGAAGATLQSYEGIGGATSN